MRNLSVDTLEASVIPFLERHAPGTGSVKISKFASGQSNPTYLVERGGARSVLRTKPPGKLLRSAHLVEREFRVMKALYGSGVPVPRMIALVDDVDSPIGRAFFLMEHVEGQVFIDPLLSGLERHERAKIYDQMNRVIANLHDLDGSALGLSDFGKPGNYFERQTRRWTQQYLAARFRSDSNMDRLIEWLELNLPPDDGEASIVHGDFRLDNMVFSLPEFEVAALIDWELSTLGHPMADLAYQCMQWRLPSDSMPPGLGGTNRVELGMPGEQEYVERYCERRSMDFPNDWTFYLAFAFFRFAAILEGVARRGMEGNASNPKSAEAYGRTVPILSKMAADILDRR